MNVIQAFDKFMTKAHKQQNKLFKKNLRSSRMKKLLKAKTKAKNK